MKTKQLLISILGIGLFIILIVMITQNPGLSKDDAYVYASRDNALIWGLQEINGENQSFNDIHNWVINTVTNGEKEYFLLAIPYEEAGIHKHYSFVALVEEKDGKYAFFKLAADVALNSPGGVEDQQNADSLVFFFDDVDGYYICVGKVYREGVAPFANGKQIAMNQDGIFSFFNKDKRPDITMQ